VASTDNRVLSTSAGTRHGSFGPGEWALVGVVSATWGSSYLWIAIGLESFAPGLIAWLRLAFGVAVLALLPRTQARIERADWRGITLIAIAGNAAPALLFALAEQTIESSVAGMMTAATPLLTLAIALALGNRTLRPMHVVGLVLGLVGVLVMSWDNVVGAATGVAGVVFVSIAVLGYAIASNVTGPLVEKYGATSVMLRALVIAAAVMTPSGILSIGESSFSLKSFIAIAILGVFGTGLARSMFASLISRAGAPRASVVGYLVPVVAVLLGVIVLGENMSPLETVGLIAVTIGAFLGSRRIRRTSGP